MNKRLVVGLIFLVILFSAIFFFIFNKSGSSSSNNLIQTSQIANNSSVKNIEIKDFAFNPSILSIKLGETVEWVNQDSAPHAITSDFGSELNSPKFNSGQKYTHTFNKIGEYSYHCSIHKSMKGKIIVE